MYSANRMNFLCVYKSRDNFIKACSLRKNATQESFICDIKLFGSEIGFTVNRLCFCCRNVTFLIAMITASYPGYLPRHADFIT